ncbi:MAG: AMP-binding protein [Planctomycetota bacterium]
MAVSTLQHRQSLRSLDRSSLEELQLEKLNKLLAAVRPTNGLYAQKLQSTPERLDSLSQLADLPFTTKDELQPPAAIDRFSRNRTFPFGDYVRYHQTSGTSGRPMAVLDTAEDWTWWIECWQYVLDAAQIGPQDRAMLAFSFGPFIGFWSAFDALVARGTLVVPGGGMNTNARIELIEKSGATCLLCTPNYAMHMAESARMHSVRLSELPIKTIVVAGEPGGSVPTIRKRIEDAWHAEVIDHGGATEVGAWGYGDAEGAGLHIVESEFIAEFLSIETGQPAADEELSHLILTTLGRHGSPVIRYRTGDLVRPRWPKGADANSGENADNFVFLEGGVLGRADDMMIIRGVNVFPSGIEHILRGFPEVVEYRMTARKRGEMDELVIEVEDHLREPARIAEELQLRLGLRIDVRLAPAMSLPRTEGKGRRFIDLRNTGASEGETSS